MRRASPRSTARVRSGRSRRRRSARGRTRRSRRRSPRAGVGRRHRAGSAGRGRKRGCRRAPKRHAVVADEVAADAEGFGEAVRRLLRGVGEPQAERAAVAEQVAEGRRVGRRRDDEDVADVRHHQRRQRIVDHRLVVDGEELFRQRDGERIEPRARAAGENDAFHDVRASCSRRVATTSRVRCAHGAARRPKVAANKLLSSCELAGRRAGVG